MRGLRVLVQKHARDTDRPGEHCFGASSVRVY